VQVFENSIWLFFTHPFDVGDVIKYETDRYTVRHIKMQFVILERVDGALVTVPTSEMTTARVHNVTRCAPRRALLCCQARPVAMLASATACSAAPPCCSFGAFCSEFGVPDATCVCCCRSELQWEGLTFTVDADTTIEQLEVVATAIVANIKLHPKWYGGDYRCFLTDSNPGFKLNMSVYYNNAGCGARSNLLRCSAEAMHAYICWPWHLLQHCVAGALSLMGGIPSCTCSRRGQ
jgi:small-conductance mechanosensitive channel